MSDAGRVPLWMVATIGGLAALGLLTLFFFGAYSGLDLHQNYNCCKNIIYKKNALGILPVHSFVL